ncbi:Bax inhibitor-1/YccA family protein [Zunongwangia sp. SCSIO 43204]|uniref:Bax inhibitor-1/YccA family protein n=1 Tax=Zunongwangia sp. SCSIO 43204 TaxID=2779359 RepID=UPI001CA8FFC7|nr:Bax inhibitor-1/YccA family protein [Zunongwangia sp. SCSIO 43204]UAB83552.1 Bax inhibitor-1/YccA family protein [Zunongwangia sp. SCSIO 43204]
MNSDSQISENIKPEDQVIYSDAQLKQGQTTYINKVFNWMSLALLITGVTAFFAAGSYELMNLIFSNKLVFYGLLIGEVVLVGYIGANIQKLSTTTATALFILYSVLNGITLSFILLVFTSASIATTFFVTAGTFGAMSAYGYFTKRDLTSIGNLCFMALIGIIIASIVNIFFFSEILYWVITYAGVLIFVGLTAYDTQKIKRMYRAGMEDSDIGHNLALMGAITLYLDFINMFLFLLRIFGDRK